MGVLAVTEALNLIECEEKFFRKTCMLAHIRCDVAVIFRSVGISLCRKFEAGLILSVAVCTELFKHLVVVGGIAHHCHVAEVLCSRAEHRGTAYINVLNRIFECHALFGDCCLKRIEVHADHLDSLDAVGFELCHMVGEVAASEKTAVHLGMQCLYAAITDLRETCHVADVDHFDSCFAKFGHGASGGDDIPTEFFERLGKLYDASLVAYAD